MEMPSVLSNLRKCLKSHVVGTRLGDDGRYEASVAQGAQRDRGR
jgi:hypothetical protein